MESRNNHEYHTKPEERGRNSKLLDCGMAELEGPLEYQADAVSLVSSFWKWATCEIPGKYVMY